jgi:hypothetical protein
LGLRNRVTPTAARLEGDDMKFPDRDGRFPFALFVVAELLCTGVLVAWVVL